VPDAPPEEAIVRDFRAGVFQHRSRGPARLALKVLFFFSPLFLLIGLVELVLWRAGETWTIERVIETQRRNPSALFMRGILDQGFYRYKFLRFEALRPKVLVLGSSRVMEFRREMFGERGKDFFNAGGLIQDLSDLHAFAENLSPATAPEVVILGLDLWWFNGNKPLLNGFSSGIHRDAALDWQEHARALRRFKSGKGCLSALKAFRAENDNIGIEARSAAVGFRPDGSMQYNFESPKGTGWKFVDRERPPIAERIRNNSAQFTPTSGASAERIELLGKCLDLLRSKKVLVLGFCPPFSSESAALLQARASQSNLWNEARGQIPKVFQDRNLPFIDASLLADFGTNDSVMIDGIHAAETFHLTLLAHFLSDPRVKGFPSLHNSIITALNSQATDPWHPDYEPLVHFRGARE
jgi:hypothetical protein